MLVVYNMLIFSDVRQPDWTDLVRSVASLIGN